MTKKKTARRALFMSVMSLIICCAMLMGTTLAWFTDSVTSAGNVITAGNLDLSVQYTLDGKNWADLQGANNLFQKDLWEPGHTEVVAMKIENKGSLALKYSASMNILNEIIGETADGQPIKLSDILTVSTLTQQADTIGDITVALAFTGENKVAYETTSPFKAANIFTEDKHLLSGDAHYLIVKVDMAETVGNEANYANDKAPSITFGINLFATQYTYEQDSFGSDYDANAALPAIPWNGEADTSWYNETDTEFVLSTPEQIAGLADLVDNNNTFEGKTLKLDSDVNLGGKVFDPIGSYRNDQSFKGTFDGQGHTISNLNQNTWELDNGYYYSDCGLGLFGALEEATVKNLIIDGTEISGESAICGSVAAVAYNTTFENITVKNTSVADYQYYAGGVVGWASGNVTFQNINLDATSTIAAQWGDFDNSTGGIIGGASGSAKILLKDCTVACRLDVYNDVTSSYQWYAYRRAGMLIGNSGKTVDVNGTTYADAPQLTCENVKVIYGDWANYTYCEFAGTSWPYVRVQAGVSNSAYSNPRYGHPTDANGNQVVDDNHVHNAGEDHFIACTFDQLYGGGQGVYGYPTHDGVTVVYNNK